MQQETTGTGATRRGLLSRIEGLMLAVAGLCLALMMLTVVGDVIGRYVFNAPFGWSYDFIGLFLMVAVFFLSLSAALADHHHIAVDLVRNRLPLRLRNLCLGLGYAASGAVLALIGWLGAGRFQKAWVNGEHLASSVGFPTWVPYALVAFGSAVMVLRCLERTVSHARAALTGVEPEGLLPEDTGDLSEV